MKAYKGFNKDMTCRGFQFEEGKTYEEPEAKLCEKGFHACEDPIACLSYYAPGESVYREVELDGVSDDRKDDSKVCAKKITVGAEIGIAGIVKAHFEYVEARCNEKHTDPQAASAGESGAASAGFKGAASAGFKGAASAGSYGAASAGSYGAASAGSYGAASAGSYGAASAGFKGAASAGFKGAASAGFKGAASAGSYGAASAGFKGAASAGEYGAAVSRGSAETNKNGLAVVRGNRVKARGGIGTVIVICEEEEDSYEIKEWKAAIVDGVNIKADTWYMLIDGEFVEVKE